MGGYYGQASDSQIAAIPSEISEGTVAIYFGVDAARVRRIRARQPQISPSRGDSCRDALVSDAGILAGDQAQRTSAKSGSALLLRAQLKSGQHFFDLSTPEGFKGFRRACEIAGLA